MNSHATNRWGIDTPGNFELMEMQTVQSWCASARLEKYTDIRQKFIITQLWTVCVFMSEKFPGASISYQSAAWLFIFIWISIYSSKVSFIKLVSFKKKRKIEGENGTKVLGSCQNNHNNSCSSNHTSSCQNNHKLLCNSNSTTTLARLTSDFEERSGLKLWEPEYLVMLQPALLDLWNICTCQILSIVIIRTDSG